jgi:hypothetical protein
MNVDAGKINIDNAFSGFNDDFYGKISDDFVGALRPQLQRSYDDAYRQLTLQMASTGNLESSSAARKFGRLYERQQDTLADIQNRALDRAQEVRAGVDETRRSLYAQNSVAADPSQAAAAAQSAAASVRPPSALPSLGDVFGDVVQGTALTYALNNLTSANQPSGGGGSPLLFNNYGNKTGRIIQ